MELDKRIMSGKKPLTCFDTEEARQFIGKECYFSNYLCNFNDINSIAPRALLHNITEDKDASNPYYSCPGYFAYCLPCEWVEEKKEAKYRPYTKSEFLNKFKCGEPINIRYKDDHINVFIETIPSVRIDNFMDDVHIRLYEGIFDLQRLFDEFEWQKSNGEWQPFGVIEDD